jgi:predicted methyltransferase
LFGVELAAQAPSPAAALTPQRIKEIVASSDRSDADRANDVRRKPAEMLAFIGIVPGMVAVDLSTGGGYTTELIARAVGPTGRVYGQSPTRRRTRASPHAARIPRPAT